MIRELPKFHIKARLSEAILDLSFFPTEKLEQITLDQNMPMKRHGATASPNGSSWKEGPGMT